MMKLPYATLALLLLLPGVGCQRPKPLEPAKEVVRYVQVKSARDGQTKSGAAYIGLVRGDVETDLSFKVSGVLEFIGPLGKQDWEEGATVTSGEVLARLQQADFINAVTMAKAKAELDQKQFERNKKLLGTGAISQQEFDIIAANKQSSEATLAQAEQNLRDSTLLCPFDGTILSRFANSGETITANKTILRIANLRTMSVELGIPDKLLGQFHVGNKIPVNISALEGSLPFAGEISEVGVAAKSEARLFKVVIKVPNPEGRIKSGMTASVPVEEIRAAPTNAVLVPLSALVARNSKEALNQLAVFVIEEDGKVREQPVKTGDLVGSAILVTKGLKPEEKVVVVGAGTLYDGAKVEALEATPLQRF